MKRGLDMARWLLASISVAGALLAPTSAAGQGRDAMPSIIVRVDDKAGIEGSLLKVAESRAAEEFAMSGIHIGWIDGREANRLELVTPYTIVFMAEASSRLKAKTDRIGPDVMGQGALFIGRAYIYYERVRDFDYDRVHDFRFPPRDIATTLGDVMAHELGHLILPPGHSTTGIMRPTINMTSRHAETFTTVEAKTIRLRLNARNLERRTADDHPETDDTK
jgi:hypothetical protein